MATTQTSNQDVKDAGSVGEAASTTSSSSSAPGTSRRSSLTVPDTVTQRFLRVEDHYYFPDRTLAFVDTGDRLKVRTNNPEVVPSIVAIAQARGWKSVQLTGTNEFRQKVWQEASLQGIGVRGYEPSALDMQQMQRALDRDQALHTVRQTPRVKAAAISSRSGTVEEKRSPPNDERESTLGVLLAHAAAPYQFDPTQRMSYYVRLKTGAGERTLWGADLERAMIESRSGPQVGDAVVLTQRGTPVAVHVPERDAQGQLVGEKKIMSQRMVWTVEKTQYIEAQDHKAALFRDPDVARSTVLTQYPDLASAAAALRLGEQFAQRIAPRAEDQARMVRAIRDRLADAIAQGRHVILPQKRENAAHVQPRGRSAPNREDPERSRA